MERARNDELNIKYQEFKDEKLENFQMLFLNELSLRRNNEEKSSTNNVDEEKCEKQLQQKKNDEILVHDLHEELEEREESTFCREFEANAKRQKFEQNPDADQMIEVPNVMEMNPKILCPYENCGKVIKNSITLNFLY